MRKIAIYSRKSRFTDKGESINNQINFCIQYALSHIEYVDKENILIYKDEGFSAKNICRPSFQKMLIDADNNLISHIICYKLDRISRNINDFSNLIKNLESKNISFICVKEQFDTSIPMGRAMMYIASVFSQLERETIAERVKDNMIMLSKSGRWLGGTVPTGLTSYKTSKKMPNGKFKSIFNLKVDKSNIDVIKKIYSLFLKSKSISNVQKELQCENQKNKLFSIQGIKGILSNPVYCTADDYSFEFFKNRGANVFFNKSHLNKNIGIIAYNKKTCKNKPNPISKWIIAPGNHSGIISGKDWVTAQNLLQSNSRFIQRNDYSLLSGILFCGKCNSKMLAKLRSSSTKSDSKPFDYICSKKIYNSHDKCDNKNVNGNYADEYVLENILKKIPSKGINLQSQLDVNRKKLLVKNSLESVICNGNNIKINFKKFPLFKV